MSFDVADDLEKVIYLGVNLNEVELNCAECDLHLGNIDKAIIR